MLTTTFTCKREVFAGNSCWDKKWLRTNTVLSATSEDGDNVTDLVHDSQIEKKQTLVDKGAV